MRLDENGNYFSDLICSYEEIAKLQDENKKLQEEIEELRKSLAEYTEQHVVEVPLGPVVFIDSVQMATCQHFYVGLISESMEVQRYVCNKCGKVRTVK